MTLIGSDGFGYTAYTQAFEALDLVPGATGVITIRTTGNNNSDAVTLSNGETFNFYGTSYTSLNVSTNGLITFGGATPPPATPTSPPPRPSAPSLPCGTTGSTPPGTQWSWRSMRTPTPTALTTG